MGSTWKPRRVTQGRPRSGPGSSAGAAGSAGPSSRSRSSRAASRPSAAWLPGAPKKSIPATWARRGPRARGGAKEVERGDGGEPRPQPRELRARLDAPLGRRLPAQRAGEVARLPGQLPVVGVARPVEHGPDLPVGEAVDHARLADERLAPAGGDLAQQPREVLARPLALGQGVDGVLDRRGAERLEAAPDLDPQVGGL